MYARLVTFSGADPTKREPIIETVRDKVIPMLREYDGYAGYISLYSEQKQRSQAIVLWESEETAEAAEPELAERRRQLSGGVGLTIESEDLYEVPVIDLEKARV
jgi:hypothetical protein